MKIKDKTVKDNVKILLMVILVLAIGALIFTGLAALIAGTVYTPWVSSIVMLIGFFIAIWILKEKASWKRAGMLVVCITALVGCFVNVQGNPLYNLPIEWVYGDMGQLNIVNETEQVGSELVIDYTFQIVNDEGIVVKSISQWAIAVFRFFEYLVIYSVLLTLLTPLIRKTRKHIPPNTGVSEPERTWDNWEELQKQELSRRKQVEIDSRQLDSNVEKTVRTLISEGETIKAIKEVRDHTSLSMQEAKELVEKLGTHE